MFVGTLQLRGTKRLTKRMLAARGETRDALKRHVQISGIEMMSAAKRFLSDPAQRKGRGGSFAAIDTGSLRSSVRSRILRGGLGVEVGSDLRHSVYVEFGTSPGFGRKLPRRRPPASALADWARRHGMAGAEFAIAKKIAERGTRPHPFMRPALRKIRQPFIDGVKRILEPGNA